VEDMVHKKSWMDEKNKNKNKRMKTFHSDEI
jgi:hypothetical protein